MKSLNQSLVSRAAGRRSRRACCAAAGALAAALAVVASGPTVAASGVTRPATLVRAADPTGTPLLRETFTGATAPDFIAYNEACLTGASQGAPPAGGHALGGCESGGQGPVPPLGAAP